MANITLRETTSLTSPGATIKGSPLTNNEVDNNFSNLNIAIGVLSNLNTSNKTNVVSALNEIVEESSSNVNITGGTISGVSNVTIAGNLSVSGNIWANTVQAFRFMDRSGNVLIIKDESGAVVWGL